MLLTSKTIVYDDNRQLQDDDGTGTTGDLVRCQVCDAVFDFADLRVEEEAP